tara:strand:+ start:10433 stop:11947 length:1515 start_codon:yes stop_codon:yes gene_type:complete
MAKILVKSSNTSTDTPTTSQATTAELCLNTKDRKLYAGTDTGSTSSPGSTAGQVSWIGAYIDNGNLSTGSADRLATQNAIKNYVDAQTHSGEVNQNAFSNIAVSGSYTIQADAKQDTLTFVAGTGVSIGNNSGTDTTTFSIGQSVAQDANVEFAELTATSTFTAETDINCDGNITCGGGDIIAVGDFDSQGGSAAAPSHTFTGDKDTGMYRVGANELGFATNGTKRLFISDSEMQLTGDMLIKASSGASDLTIHGPSGQHANLFLFCDNAANDADKFKIQAGTDGYLRFFFNNGSYVEGASLKSNGSFSFANSTTFSGGFSVSGGTAYIGGTSIRNAAILNAGTVATARLGSGTASSSTYLRGDQTWAAVSGGSSAVYVIGYTDLRGSSTAKYLGLGGGTGSTSTNFGSQMAAGCHFIAPATGNLDSVRMVMESSWGSSTSIKVYVNAILARSITQSLTSTGSSNDYNIPLDANANAGDTITVKVDPSATSPQAAAWTFKYIPD